MFHFNHNWCYYGKKSKWRFDKRTTAVYLYPERKCLTCWKTEQLEGVALQGDTSLIKTWVQIYKSEYEEKDGKDDTG